MSQASRSAIQATVDRASAASFDSMELVYSPSSSWPVPPDVSAAGPSDLTRDRSVHISVLDSSFNPPHLAHLGLATSAFPPPYPATSPSSTAQSSASSTVSKWDASKRPRGGEYNARLLLLSLRNVDKSPSPGDASPMQKLEMVILLARHIDQYYPTWGGTAVGLLTKPTFVGKSRIVRRFLLDRLRAPPPPSPSSPSSDVASLTVGLSFIVGTDTLVRFFDPKYYPTGQMESQLSVFFETPPEGDGSYLISARRGIGETSEALEDEILRRQGIAEWAQKGRVRLMGSAGEGREEISSTSIRRAVQAGDRKTLGSLVIPSIAEYIHREGLYTA